MKLDVYHYDCVLERAVKRIKSNERISESQRRMILKFQKQCIADGLSAARVLRYLCDLPRLGEYLRKDFEQATKEDIVDVINQIERTSLSPRTKLDFKSSIKKFYKWLNGGEEYPEFVRWIKTGGKKNNNKLPEELLAEEEVKKLIETAHQPRDRAIISVLWESGCRVGEILSMQIKHVTFEKEFARITVQGKTGGRRVPLIDSVPYIAEWINNHPFKENPEAPLWVGLTSSGYNKPLEYGALRKMIMEIAKKSGIKKRVNPHNFRHSRATFLANHLTEAQMNKYLGWVGGSDMPAIYVHLSGRDVDDAILQMRGLKPKEEENVESSLKPRTCARCGLVNKATGRFCNRCGAVLDIQTAVAMQDEIHKLDDKFSKLLQDNKVQEFLVKRLIELGIS